MNSREKSEKVLERTRSIVAILQSSVMADTEIDPDRLSSVLEQIDENLGVLEQLIEHADFRNEMKN